MFLFAQYVFTKQQSKEFSGLEVGPNVAGSVRTLRWIAKFGVNFSVGSIARLPSVEIMPRFATISEIIVRNDEVLFSVLHFLTLFLMIISWLTQSVRVMKCIQK